MKNGVGMLATLAALAIWAPLTRAQTQEPGNPHPTTTATEPAQPEHPADEAPAADQPRTPAGEPGEAAPGRPHEGRPSRNRNVVLLEAFREEVKRMLQADEETNGYIDEIYKEHLELLQEEGGDVAEQRREQANEMRELVSELRDAQREGDTERATELREKITALRGHTDGEQTVDLVQLQADMREVLDDEQFERFTAVQRKYEPRFTRSKNTNEQAMQRIRQVVATVELTDEQRERTRELFVEYAQTIRRLRGDEAKGAEAVQALHDAVVEQLDDSQVEDFERKLAEAEKRDGAGAAAAAHGRRPGRDMTVQPVAPPVAPPADDEQAAEGTAEHPDGQAEGEGLPPE